MRLFLYIAALVAGALVARIKLLPEFLENKMVLIGTMALVLLLFSMGMSMGSDPQILASLPALGLKALILALSIIVGSTLMVWLIMPKKTKGKE